MNNKGFSLISVLLGLFLLGLICITVIPILTSSFLSISKNKTKLEMSYIGEMVLEKIQSYDEENSLEDVIFNRKTSNIIESFENQSISEITLKEKRHGEDYLLKILKEEKTSELWTIRIYVYHDKQGSNLQHVEYKTYIPKK